MYINSHKKHLTRKSSFDRFNALYYLRIFKVLIKLKANHQLYKQVNYNMHLTRFTRLICFGKITINQI